MTVRLLGEAEQELTAAAQWYEQRSAGLGGRFLEEAGEGFSAIGRNPRRYLRVRFAKHREVRRYLLPHFPYAVIYEIREVECLVAAVSHTARRPGYWAKRLK